MKAFSRLLKILTTLLDYCARKHRHFREVVFIIYSKEGLYDSKSDCLVSLSGK